MKLKRNIYLGPITKNLQSKLDLPLSKSFIMPMSIPDHYIATFKKSKYRKLNKIVYVGNHLSGKEKLDLDLLNDTANLIYKKFPIWKFEIIGIPKSLFYKFCKNPLSKNLIFSGRLSHKSVFESLIVSKIGLLIYPDNEYFLDSFPIKIIEYATARLAIVASNTRSHRNILGMSNCLFFEQGDYEDLASKIEILITKPKLIRYVSSRAYDWAEGFTYQNRVRNIISLIER
jgi:glycosyltransferase involved in cell wall biosynthesis